MAKKQQYQRTKKPMLERHRRARVTNCLSTLRQLIAECSDNDNVLRMDKIVMLETTIAYMRQQQSAKKNKQQRTAAADIMHNFRHGYMNAVEEVSRMLASIPGVNIEMGKTIMTHLGRVYNRLQVKQQKIQQQQQRSYYRNQLPIMNLPQAALSPASSGYYSDDCESTKSTKSPQVETIPQENIWRPW
uniref:Enhancer of split region protein HLHm8 n=2 Tax=Teleopsis dalmanni TaxID=139649 RepID=G9I1M3_TELDL|nr:enhancer of split region protein HLHm8 [Teleopsis dalmanni]